MAWDELSTRFWVGIAVAVITLLIAIAAYGYLSGSWDNAGLQ